MGARLTSNALPAKAIRIVLVFALVFWASFRVECLAFGDVVHDSFSKHSEGTLNDVELWKVKSQSNIEIEGERVSSAGFTASGKSEARIAPISVGSAVCLIAVPSWQDSESGDDILIGDDLQWEVDKEECVDLTVKNGVATLVGKSAGTVTVSCSLKDSDKKYVSDSFKEKYKDKPFVASFKVDVQNPELAIELLDQNGNALEAGQVLRLSETERQSYAFGARIALIDPESHAKIAEFSDKDQSGLDDNLRGLLSDFEWSLVSDDGGEVDAETATISPDGVLHMEKGGAFSVYGSIRLGELSYSASIRVESDAGQSSESSSSASPDQPEADDGQGASHPQKQLRVVANIGADSGPDANEGESSGSAAKADEQSSEASSPASASSGSAASSSGDAQAPSGESPSADAAQPDAPQPINKLYDIEDLEALGMLQGTYSMYGSRGWQVVKGEGPSLADLLKDAGIEDLSKIESITFEGLYGTTEVSWDDLTAARYYYAHALEGDYADGKPSTPMVAIRSYQYSAEELTGPKDASPSESPNSSNASSASSSSAAAETSDEPNQASAQAEAIPDLVDNTQFRMLFGATNPPDATIEPDSLRWIHTIHVNMKGSPKDDVPTDPKLRVRVGYVPVPIGSTAVFSAIPNNEIGNARFGFHWQESSDGVTWEDIPNSSIQTLRILTTEDRLGHQFRVIMETNLQNEEGEERGTTSDPVTMVEGSGFAVQLAYDPPLAGDTAIFQSSLSGISDPKEIKEYEWQSSTDGGETWTTVPGRTGPQLALPTNPIEQRPSDSAANPGGSSEGGESGSGASAKVNPIIYIRVIARATDGREAYSNVVPLTVRVGDSDDDNSGDGSPGSGDSGSGQASPGEGGSQAPDQPAPEPSAPTVTEIDRIVYEESGTTAGQTPSPQEPASTPQQPAGASPISGQQPAVPEIYINPEMSEQILEQVQAEQAQVTATTPGARWTEINAVNPGGDDVRRILSSNPFAPFVMPLGLGLVVAGGLERFLSFRRSIK